MGNGKHLLIRKRRSNCECDPVLAGSIVASIEQDRTNFTFGNSRVGAETEVRIASTLSGWLANLEKPGV